MCPRKLYSLESAARITVTEERRFPCKSLSLSRRARNLAGEKSLGTALGMDFVGLAGNRKIDEQMDEHGAAREQKSIKPWP